MAGTGVDSNMFARIMAPLTPVGEVRRGRLYPRNGCPNWPGWPTTAIHDPEEAGCRPNDYPAKIIGHREARERALAAVKRIG